MKPWAEVAGLNRSSFRQRRRGAEAQRKDFLDRINKIYRIIMV